MKSEAHLEIIENGKHWTRNRENAHAQTLWSSIGFWIIPNLGLPREFLPGFLNRCGGTLPGQVPPELAWRPHRIGCFKMLSYPVSWIKQYYPNIICPGAQLENTNLSISCFFWRSWSQFKIFKIWATPISRICRHASLQTFRFVRRGDSQNNISEMISDLFLDYFEYFCESQVTNSGFMGGRGHFHQPWKS